MNLKLGHKLYDHALFFFGVRQIQVIMLDRICQPWLEDVLGV